MDEVRLSKSEVWRLAQLKLADQYERYCASMPPLNAPVEIIATEIAREKEGCNAFDFDNCPEDGVGPCFCIDEARRAVAALEAAGYRIVSAEPCKEYSAFHDGGAPTADDVRGILGPPIKSFDEGRELLREAVDMIDNYRHENTSGLRFKRLVDVLHVRITTYLEKENSNG